MVRLGAALVVTALWAPVSMTAQANFEYEDYKLDNGLRVFLVENHSAPVVTVDVWYNVGSRNERVGRSGFAHLFEHMMFQGSENVKKGEHGQLITRVGGVRNGSTNEGRTNYFETVPANRMNLALWLEADRMRSLAVTEENFENQREVVKEERRLRIDNQPYIPAVLDGTTLMYDSTECFAYAHQPIGSMDDLNSAVVSDVKEFFDLYYVPNNATIAVVGDFDPTEARALIDRYFGDVPRGEDHPPVTCSSTYDPGARTREWEDEHANLPAVIVAYRTPPHSDPDTRALDLVTTILGGGESSRLNRAMVREAKTALQAGVQQNSRRGPGMLAAVAIANQGVDAATLQQQLSEQVARIVAEGVTDQELEKAKNDFRASFVFGSQTTMQVAERLLHYAHYHDSMDEIHTDLDEYMKVTADDIRSVAAKYLVPENSFAIVIVPQSGTGEGVVP
jgi:zinc protease